MLAKDKEEIQERTSNCYQEHKEEIQESAVDIVIDLLEELSVARMNNELIFA